MMRPRAESGLLPDPHETGPRRAAARAAARRGPSVGDPGLMEHRTGLSSIGALRGVTISHMRPILLLVFLSVAPGCATTVVLEGVLPREPQRDRLDAEDLTDMGT